jgi:hypothetical protein
LNPGLFSTSTSKVYFLTGFSVIFANFNRIAAEWMICKAQIEGARLEERWKIRKAMIVMRLAENSQAAWLEVSVRAGSKY